MLEKWHKAPARVGMVVGFVALPLLWWLQSALIGLVLPFIQIPLFDLRYYFSLGAIPGAILGAGISKSFSSASSGHLKSSKRPLLVSGAVVTLLFLAKNLQIFLLVSNTGTPRTATFNGFSMPLWVALLVNSVITEFPFQLALLMLFIGFAMRSKPSKPAL